MFGRTAALVGFCFLTRSLAINDAALGPPGTCMVQRKAEQIGKRKVQKQSPKTFPWDFHNYLAVGFHKSGNQMMYGIYSAVWAAYGLPKDRLGFWGDPCYFGGECYNWGSSVRFLIDMYSMEIHGRELERAGQMRSLRVAGPVRNPLVMIASAYCYHHSGKEETNRMFFPQGTVERLGPQEGVAFVAQCMMELVENMTGVYEHPRNDTLRLSYENATESSEGFDREVNRLLDFWFEGVPASSEQRKNALDWAAVADLHRHPEPNYTDHTNDAGCMKLAQHAVFAMPTDLLRKYQSFAQRLGYPFTEDLLPPVT
mmetsp:Transcript_55320/g.129808  ORF Transcript_55320/g.129808 Transcript_55320/m.129808 type:complete len:313 (+) Transcript_55320:118-1056(+)